MSECCLYNIIKMVIVYVWMLFILYYKMKVGVCVNALNIILLKWHWVYVYEFSFFDIRKEEMVYDWMFFIWYYKNEGFYVWMNLLW